MTELEDAELRILVLRLKPKRVRGESWTWTSGEMTLTKAYSAATHIASTTVTMPVGIWVDYDV